MSPTPCRVLIRRAYLEPTAADGYRVLIDRFWPRGRSRDALRLDAWARELAPSPELIRWFGHDPARWEDFRARYRAELAMPERRQPLQALLDAAYPRPLTLVYGARDEERNQALVLREALLELAAG